MRFERDNKMNLNFQPTELGTLTQNEAPQVNILTSAHKALRGRYRWAAALAIMLGATGSLVGFNLTEPLYTSQGLVDVDSKLNPILGGIREQEKLDAFDSVVAKQVDVIASARNLTRASQLLIEGNSDWPIGTAGLSSLQSSLSIDRKRGQQVIHVNVTHFNPQLSFDALSAILDSYKKYYDHEASESLTARRAALDIHRKNLVTKLGRARNDAAAKSDPYMTSDLTQLQEEYYADIQEMQERIDEIDERIIEAAAIVNSEDPAEGQTDSQQENDPTNETPALTTEDDAIDSIENLATIDVRLADLMAQQSEKQAELEASNLDYGPSHFKIRNLKRAVEQIKTQIESRVVELRALIKSGQLSLVEISPFNDIESVEKLEEAKAKFITLITEKQKTVTAIATAQTAVLELLDNEKRFEQQLAEANAEIDAIDLEMTNVVELGRIEISKGWVPNEPSRDRRKPLALLGGTAGIGFGISIIWLFGLLRPAFRYIDEIEGTPQLPLIGTLPDLTNPVNEQMAVASLGIHHLRNMLALRTTIERDNTAITYMITSPRAGDGKTCISLALGISFASAGMRTLLLDLDLVGRGLSRSLDHQRDPGFVDVLGQSKIDGQIYSTEIDNLWLMPAGNPESCRPEELPANELQRILALLQGEFDVILVDTGPLMGSLEAGLAASLVDETIMVVSRGQKPRIVEAAIGKLEQVGGTCAGIVFNRANNNDLARSVSHASFHSQSIRSTGPRIPGTPEENLTEPAPVAPTASPKQTSNVTGALALAIMDATSSESSPDDPNQDLAN